MLSPTLSRGIAAVALLLVIVAAYPQEAPWKSAAAGKKRDAVVAAVKAGDLAAARYLIQAGMWEETAGLDPDAAPLLAWKNGTDQVDGITTTQAYAVILANWTVRQKDLGKERTLELLITARDILQAHPVEHPIIAQELSWLCRDVPPEINRVRELRLKAGELFDRLPVPLDPLLAARWHLAMTDQGGGLRAVDAMYERAVTAADLAEDTLMIAEALQAWIAERSRWLDQPAAKDELQYDADSVLRLYGRLDTVLNERRDDLGRAHASWRCGHFVVSRQRRPQALPLFAFAAKVFGEQNQPGWQGQALMEQLECLRSLAFSSKEGVEGQRLELARQALACFTLSKDQLGLARAHRALGELLPDGSDEALAEFRTEANLFAEMGRKADAGQALFSIAGEVSSKRNKAFIAKNDDEEQRYARQEFDLLSEALELTLEAPLEQSIAYGREKRGWLHLMLTPDQPHLAVADLREAVRLYGRLGEEESVLRLLERTAELCVTENLAHVANELWRELGDFTYGFRDRPDGPRWLEKAAAYYEKSGFPDVPVKPWVIDPTRDETQGRSAERLHELCQQAATATTKEEIAQPMMAIVALLGCEMPVFRVDRLRECQPFWFLSRADCKALLTALSYPQYAGAAGDLITGLGRLPGAEVLAAAMSHLPRNKETAWVKNLLIVELEQVSPELARRKLPLALEELSLDGLRLAARLLPEAEFHAVLRRGLTSPVWEVKIHALRILNRLPESLDEQQLAEMALNSVPVWGHRVEALHGLILQGRPFCHSVIIGLLSDDGVPEELRLLAIKGAAYLRIPRCETALLNLLDDQACHASAARALTYLGVSAHVKQMRVWLAQPVQGRFDERQVVAHVALWSLEGEMNSRAWLAQAMSDPSQPSIQVQMMRSLAWSSGQRAADLFSDLIVQRKFEDHWFTSETNRDNLQRGLSRLPLTAAQIAAVEPVLRGPVPAPCMDKSTTRDDTIDKKPQAPWLTPRIPITTP